MGQTLVSHGYSPTVQIYDVVAAKPSWGTKERRIEPGPVRVRAFRFAAEDCFLAVVYSPLVPSGVASAARVGANDPNA